MAYSLSGLAKEVTGPNKVQGELGIFEYKGERNQEEEERRDRIADYRVAVIGS